MTFTQTASNSHQKSMFVFKDILQCSSIPPTVTEVISQVLSQGHSSAGIS